MRSFKQKLFKKSFLHAEHTNCVFCYIFEQIMIGKISSSHNKEDCQNKISLKQI